MLKVGRQRKKAIGKTRKRVSLRDREGEKRQRKETEREKEKRQRKETEREKEKRQRKETEKGTKKKKWMIHFEEKKKEYEYERWGKWHCGKGL